MFNSHQLRRQQQKSTFIFSNLINTWKVRPMNGFEKYLFSNTQTSLNNAIVSIKSIQKHNIDPSRFIYPRDAMGNMLIPLVNRNTHISIPFYLPKYDLIKIHSPTWTIKNKYHSKEMNHYVGPMTYDSINDKSQLPCKSGWTQIGRQKYKIHSELTVPFYDTRKYKQVGDRYSKHAIILGRRTVHTDIKTKKLSNIIKRKSQDNIKYTYDIQDYEAITKRNEFIDTSLSSTKNIYRKSNNLITSNDHINKIETIDLPILESSIKLEPTVIATEQEIIVLEDEKTSAKIHN
ncbi:unnamed protein product [Rotaria sp. Silwood2]|nr:unnamed protein product [Rotaria sp. Silwood2]CAF2759869.1 unnamed protein product [Rotaria sp. Silwood2]CAF4181360.1 unnamed protein product [Rotaria sp. Silwood2]CAF4424855.1 unnamed protein product [Rotaria sp. Silwood2]